MRNMIVRLSCTVMRAGIRCVEETAGGRTVIEAAYAVRYDGEVEQGRTAPLRVHIETETGEMTDVILKATVTPHLSIEGLANEMLGALLAGDLGLPIPKPYFVTVSPEFIASVPNAVVRGRLASACPIAFASTDVGSQWRKWNSTDHLTAQNANLALKILAFDAFIGNPDRSPKNPNLLTNKSDPRLILIDHECAFGIRMKLFPRLTPWVLGNLSHIAARGSDGEHLFHSALVGRDELDFDAIAAEWNGLSEVRFGAYDALLPQAWDEARPALRDAFTYFGELRNNMPDCIAELRRILQ